MDPRGTVGRIYKEEHYTLLQTKYESSGPCGFGEEFFLCFSHDAPGAGPVWTPGARLAGFLISINLFLILISMLILLSLEIVKIQNMFINPLDILLLEI